MPLEAPDVPDDLIRITEAAKMVDVNRATIFRWIDRGFLRSWALGAQRRVSKGAVLGLLTEVRKPNAAPMRVRTASEVQTHRVLKQAGML
jgi:excisionase family DNA binding protein